MINTTHLQEVLTAAEVGPHQCSREVSLVMAFMTLVQASILRKSKQSSKLPNLSQEKFDFIVVGAGAAGSVVANRLSAYHSVLLLEAGTEEPSETCEIGTHSYLMGSAIDWQFRAQPEPQVCGGKGCDYPRGKALGGSTTINSMMYLRGNPRDYDSWRDLGNPGWGWEDVLPFFKRYEDNRDGEFSKYREVHSTGGPQSVERFPTYDYNTQLFYDAFRELGFPPIEAGPHENREGVYFLQFLQRDGRRQSTNHAYLRPIRKARASTLRIVTGARVTKVIIDDNKVARGVQYTSEHLGGNGEVFSVYAEKEVILCAGTLLTPQVLLLSGVGPKEVLDQFQIKQIHELPVGRNFQDHVTSDFFYLRVPKTSTPMPMDASPWVEAQKEYNRKSNGPMATVNPLQTLAFFASNFTKADYPDVEITLSPAVGSPSCLARGDELEKCANETWDRSCTQTSYPFYEDVSVACSVLHPRSRGYITLTSANPFDAPLFYSNYLTTEEDVSVLVQAYERVKQLSVTKTLLYSGFYVKAGRLSQCTDYEFLSEEYIRCALRSYSRTNHHQCCTSKMGPVGDPYAVVDPRLRVQGIERLRVIDTSIMPHITSGNVVAPTIMIGEKGSDLILQDWRKSL